MEASPTSSISRALARVVDVAREQPERVLLCVLAVHIVVWTLLPVLFFRNLQLDLLEGLALGKEWQLGYWKHPPLPWWIVAGVYKITGHFQFVYLLGPLASAICLYLVFQLGRETLGPLPALIAALSLEGLHFFNFSAVKFSHDVLQLPVWAMAGLLFYRALKRQQTVDWIAAGAMMAVAFWSKYVAFVLGVSFAYILLFDRDARRSWKTSGPYLMAASFLVVLSPHLWWLITHDFQPLQYFDSRAVHAAQWYQSFWFPLRWTFSQVFFLIPTAALLSILYIRRSGQRHTDATAFTRRYLTVLAIGPFIVSTLGGILLGRSLVPLWGYPLWIFAPLGFMAWYAPRLGRDWLRHFAAAFLAVFVFVPLLYASSETFGPMVETRQRATQFPGERFAAIITARWRERTGLPLRYVGGTPAARGPGEFAANNVAVYSPDRPHVIVHGTPAYSAWIDPKAVERDGAVFVWEQSPDGPAIPPELQELWPRLEPQPRIELPRLGPFTGRISAVHYAFLPPKR